MAEGWSLPPEREAAEFDLEVNDQSFMLALPARLIGSLDHVTHEVTVHLLRGENVAIKDLPHAVTLAASSTSTALICRCSRRPRPSGPRIQTCRRSSYSKRGRGGTFPWSW